jgi:hypothetical protein
MTADDLAIAITTAPRDRETFAASLASLRAAGFVQQVRVLADKVSPEGEGCVITRNDPPLDGIKNWYKACRTLLDETAATWLMILEDDVTWAKGASEALYRDLGALDPATTGYLSLYLCRHVAKHIQREAHAKRLPPGMHDAASMGGRCWGSQAYVLPRQSAEKLLSDRIFTNMVQIRWKNRDLLVSGTLSRHGKKLLYRVPCLVNHKLGNANSSLTKKGVMPDLLTDYWTGEP